nr:hypothetical protein [uncultured Actinoplanes sp.]
MRIPTFSRQTATDTPATDERPAPAGTTATSPVRPRSGAETTTDLPPVPRAESRTDLPPGARRTEAPAAPRTDPPPPPPAAKAAYPATEPSTPAGPKPRASLLATLALILGVAGALLVLSGPLLGYGIGVAGLGLILSLAGIRATSKRHVAGKTDALLGMVFSLAAIVVGVLALTGSLNWLGTDTQPVNDLREWLDTQFGNRF